MNPINALVESGHAPAPVSLGALGWAERGWVPDLLIRRAIRALCSRRLKEEWAGGVEEQSARFHSRIELLRHSPLALHTDTANAQHYELPPAFFQHCLGARLKYSCAYFARGAETLNEAEDAMESRCQQSRDHAGADAGVWDPERRAVVAALANVLDGLCRVVWVCERAGVAGGALSVRAAQSPRW